MALAQGLLAHGLGHGVGVGPAQRRGPGPTGIDQAGLHPLGSELFGLGGEQRGAGAAQFFAGAVHELGQAGGCSALGLGVGAEAAGPVDLALPVDVADPEGALVHRDLVGRSPAVASHVAGGHGDHVGGDAEVLEGPGDAGRTEEVHLDGQVQR